MSRIPKPWERQLDEGAEAFEAFSTYRNMGPGRTIKLVGKELGKSESLLNRWSSKYKWVQRIGEWDSYLDEQTQEELVLEYKQQSRRRMMIAGQMHELVLKRLMGDHRVEAIDPNKLSASDLVRLMQLASNIEILESGGVTDRVENKTETKFSIENLWEALDRKRAAAAEIDDADIIEIEQALEDSDE